MTSSLVGSEMCIRDREKALVAVWWMITLVAAQGPLHRSQRLRWSGPCACLLYTSDAADDM
eukprot:11601428-Prorocentrum_lima.AAC.1